MTPTDVSVWIQFLESKGLTFIREIEGVNYAIDFVVVDQVDGPTCKCEWVESEFTDGHRWVRITGELPGEFVTPRDWQPDNKQNLKKVLLHDADGLPIARSQMLDITIDSETGETRYVGRPFAHQHDYDDLIRRAKNEIRFENYQSAYALILKAEQVERLIEERRVGFTSWITN